MRGGKNRPEIPEPLSFSIPHDHDENPRKTTTRPFVALDASQATAGALSEFRVLGLK